MALACAPPRDFENSQALRPITNGLMAHSKLPPDRGGVLLVTLTNHGLATSYLFRLYRNLFLNLKYLKILTLFFIRKHIERKNSKKP